MAKTKIDRDDYPATALRRFYRKIAIKENGCWEWTGTLTEGGYGIISYKRKPKRTHRFAFEMIKGPIPKGLDLDHLCRNRACANPEHLEPVTRKENLSRSPLNPSKCGGLALRKMKLARETCKNGHPWNEENTRTGKEGWRQCRACNRKYANERYARLKHTKYWLKLGYWRFGPEDGETLN